MKLKYLIPALAPMLFAACTVDDEVLVDGTNGKIEFAPELELASRANPISNESTTGNLTEFTVAAYSKDKKINFFEKVKVKKQSDGTWKTEGGDYYWGNYNLTFKAYATNRGSALITKNGKDIFNDYFPITTEGKKVSDADVKVGWADAPGKITNVIIPTTTTQMYDLLVATNWNVATGTTKIPIHFEHAFSVVELYVRGDNPANWYKVEEFLIGNIYNQGDLTFPQNTTVINGTPKTQLTVNSWSIPASATKVNWWGPDVNFDFRGDKTTKESVMAGVSELFIMPQNITPWDPVKEPKISEAKGSFIGIKMGIKQLQDGSIANPVKADFTNQIWPETAGTTAKFLYAPLKIAKFEPNKKYIIIANITGGGYDDTGKEKGFKMTFTVTVSDLGTGTTNTITF